MAKQIQVSTGLPTAALEERVHALEARLTAVTAAVRILAYGLEDVPLAVPGGRPAAESSELDNPFAVQHHLNEHYPARNADRTWLLLAKVDDRCHRPAAVWALMSSRH